MSKDAEGNNYYPCAELVERYYVPESTWSGEIYSEENLKEYGISKEEAIRAIIIYPGYRVSDESMLAESLLHQLEFFDETLEVILSKDSEGNGFSPLSDAGEGFYATDEFFGGFVLNEKDLEEEGYTQEECLKVIALYPIN